MKQFSQEWKSQGQKNMWQTKNRIRDIHHVDVQTICLLIRHEVIHIWGKSSGIRIKLAKSNLEKSKKNSEN